MKRRRDKPVQLNLNTVIVAILLPLLVFTFFSFSATMQTYIPGTVIDVGRTISPIVDIGNERVVVFKPGTIWGPGRATHLINGGGGVDSYAYQETTNYGAVSQTTEVSRTTVGNTQTTTVTITTSDPQTGTTLQRDTTSVAVNTATMTGTISTTRDHRGSVADQVSYAVLQPILAPGATYMVERPEVRGNVRMTLRVVYSDNTFKDIEKQITIHYVASMLYERATGKHVKEFRVRAQGEITLVGMGTQSNADMLFVLHAKPVVSSGQKIETKQVSNRVFLDSKTGWKAPVNLEITIPASDVAITPSVFYETSQGEYSILSSFELRATLRDYWEYPAKIRRELQLGGITEGPSCGGLYRLANPGVKNRYEIVGKYYDMDWIAEYSSGLLAGMDELSFRWSEGKLSVSGQCHVPGTYSFNLRAPKGKWSGTSFTMTRSAGRFSMVVDGPKPAPVTGKVNILFTSFLNTMPDKPLTTDTLRVSVLKYTFNRAANTYETSKVWEGELTSGVRQTISVTLTHGESLSVRCTKNGWYKEQTRYGGTAEYSVYDAGDWFYFCENPEMDVNIKVIVPFRADVVQGIPEFRVETTTNTNTISVNSPDTSVEVKTSLPFAAMGQVPEGTPGARKLVVQAQPGELNFPPGTYWFKDGSVVHVRVVSGADYVTVDGERRVTGGYQTFTVVMNADRYIKVYAGAATRTVKYGVEGTVMDGERRTPIPGAMVRVYEYGREWEWNKPVTTAVTDSKGYFRFEVENRYASYTIIAIANGYKEFKTSISAPNIIAIFLFPPSSSAKEYPENYYASANPNDVHNVVVEVKGNDVVRTYYGTESFVTGGEKGVENTMLPFIGKPTGVRIETENREITVGKESFRLEGGSYEFQATPERITSGVMTSEALDISAYGLLIISLVIGTALAMLIIRGLGKGSEERAKYATSWKKRR